MKSLLHGVTQTLAPESQITLKHLLMSFKVDDTLSCGDFATDAIMDDKTLARYFLGTLDMPFVMVDWVL